MDTTLQAQTTVQLHTVPHIQSLSKYFESHLFSLKKLGPSKSKNLKLPIQPLKIGF